MQKGIKGEGVRMKICGLSREEDILCANEILPDYIGFVFAPKSRRYVAPARARALRALLDGRICPVGVFVNEDPALVARLLSEGIIEVAQLHGQEDEAYLADLRSRTDKKIIQAFRIGKEDDVKRAAASSAWRVLADHGTGGTGERFDWALLRDLERPCFLAGGLDPNNVAEAIRQVHPFAVDVSSGVERDGRKDPEKMRAFARAVRSMI